VNLNYLQLDNLYKRILSAVESLGLVFKVLATGRVDWGRYRAPIQLDDFLSVRFQTRIEPSQDKGLFAQRLKGWANFNLVLLRLSFHEKFGKEAHQYQIQTSNEGITQFHN
jgi:hypothetical protein